MSVRVSGYRPNCLTAMEGNAELQHCQVHAAVFVGDDPVALPSDVRQRRRSRRFDDAGQVGEAM